MPYKKTSLCIEARARRAARSRSGGAVFLEAVVVISGLTLGLLGLVYIRDLYVKQLGASRLARAALIAHSMAGCKSNQPRAWLGRDLADYTAQDANQDRQSARGRDSAGTATGANSARANGLLQRSGVTSSDGQGLLNPIADAEFGGQAEASGGRLAGSQPVFLGTVRARSYVSCGDQVKDGDFDRILEVMSDELSNLLGK